MKPETKKTFIGIMMGMGMVSGMGLKLWKTAADTVPPFWLWAVPGLFVAIGLIVWFNRKREHADLAARIERSARVPRRETPSHLEEGGETGPG